MIAQQTAPNTVVFNGHTISFPMEIDDFAVMKDRIAILVNRRYWADNDSEGARNVYCYGADGKLLWRIEESGEIRREKGVVAVYYGYVTLAYDIAKDELEACGADWDFVIDKDTGRVTDFKRRDR